ncbi:EF-hand domain-containing protein [Ectothiorhodospiraceae bacterium 2226]|nr:EF-hand domain-containing protein [Ectothiorhodospiraceae bacterium 2226]
MAIKDKAALVLALSMFTGASMATDAGAGAAQGDAVEGDSPITQQDGAYGAVGGTGPDEAAEAPGASPPPGADGMREDEVATWASDEHRERFEQLDTAGTGYLTREEVEGDAELAERFDEIDRDQTGVISEAEFAQFMEEQEGGAPGVEGDVGAPGAPEGVEVQPGEETTSPEGTEGGL